MKTITLTVSDNYYNTFMEFFKHNPHVKFDEKEYAAWQEEIVLNRVKNGTSDDYQPLEEALKELDKKWL